MVTSLLAIFWSKTKTDGSVATVGAAPVVVAVVAFATKSMPVAARVARASPDLIARVFNLCSNAVSMIVCPL